jgi:hypothetical protein
MQQRLIEQLGEQQWDRIQHQFAAFAGPKAWHYLPDKRRE